MKNICLQSAVWDLHIHSNKCTKPDKELAKLSTEKYIDQLLSLFADYPALKMFLLLITIAFLKKSITIQLKRIERYPFARNRN